MADHDPLRNSEESVDINTDEYLLKPKSNLVCYPVSKPPLRHYSPISSSSESLGVRGGKTPLNLTRGYWMDSLWKLRILWEVFI